MRSGWLQSNFTETESVSSPPPPSLPLPSQTQLPLLTITTFTTNTTSCSPRPTIQLWKIRCPSVLKSDRGWQRHRAAVNGGIGCTAGDYLGQTFSMEEEKQAWRETFSLSKRVGCPRCNDAAFPRKSKMLDHLKTCKVSLLSVRAESREELSQ